MIVKILSRGKSFKGLSTYLTHDADAKTDERVAWTHTLNLANDDVPCAVNEMLWTARDAELLKQEAGVRAGGRATENPVKHLSLNWAPDQNPTREHMIETTEHFLRQMKWHEHQAVLVAHDDKSHAHVHVMLNVVHPETGLRFDDAFERRRVQAWALEYEREQGRVYCEQRLMNPAERLDAPPRNIWLTFQENENEFQNSEKSLQQHEPISMDGTGDRENADWEMLKQIQRDERIEFFARGKSEFSQLRLSIYREIREEFRPRWADFYAAQRDGADPEILAGLKAELVAEQKAVLEGRRDQACGELRQSRDLRYCALLDDQHDIRAVLRDRQGEGLDNAHFLEELADRSFMRTSAEGFHEVGNEVTKPAYRVGAPPRDDGANTISGGGGEVDVGDRVGGGLISFVDSLFYDLINLGSARPARAPQTDSTGRSLIEIAAEEACKRQQQHEREEEDAERRRRQRTPCGE